MKLVDCEVCDRREIIVVAFHMTAVLSSLNYLKLTKFSAALCCWLKHLNSFPDMLELYFEKNWTLPDRIVMIADEQAAIVTFNDPKGFSLIFTTDVLLLFVNVYI